MLRGLVTTIFSIGWAIVLVLTGGRFLALLTNANRDSELVDRLLRHSDFWVRPFFRMFDLANESVGDHGGVFEPASFIAFAVYFLGGLLILAVFRSTLSGHDHRQVTTYET